VARIAKNYRLPARPIPSIGRERLRAYAWPGNVRELAHVIERSLVFEDDALMFSALAAVTPKIGADGGLVGPRFRIPANGFSLDATIDALIQRALEQTDGNVSAAARLLGVERDFVRYRLKSRPGNFAAVTQGR
jgi:DNA-binding NtrC family response regulator